MFGCDNRWKHLSGKPTPRWTFPEDLMKTTCLIGWVCNGWEPFSWPVLIGRLAYILLRMIMLFHFLIKCKALCWLDNTKLTIEWWIKPISLYCDIDLIHDSGGYREEETPCPISNQEAKLFIADNTFPYWDGNVGRCQFRDSLLLIILSSRLIQRRCPPCFIIIIKLFPSHYQQSFNSLKSNIFLILFSSFLNVHVYKCKILSTLAMTLITLFTSYLYPWYISLYWKTYIFAWD